MVSWVFHVDTQIGYEMVSDMLMPWGWEYAYDFVVFLNTLGTSLEWFRLEEPSLNGETL